MYRPIAAAAVVAFLCVVGATLAPAAEEPVACSSKADHIALVYKKIPAAVVTDLDGPLEEIFLLNLSGLAERDLTGTDVVLTRNEGFATTLIALFDRGGCMVAMDQLPNELVSALLGGKEAEA